MNEEARKILKSVLWYQRHGYSIIPVRKNKKPYVAWEQFQTERPSPDQIQAWWSKWPSANIGIITGEVSGVDVVDCDSEDGRDALNEFLPDSFVTPVSKTPKGYHFFFKHRPGLSNGVRVLTDTDLRTTGGYVVAPPSKNGDGKGYTWMQGLKISDVEPGPMPDMLFEILQSGGQDKRAFTREHRLKNGKNLYNKNDHSSDTSKGGGEADNIRQHSTTNDNILFCQGHRDESLFHVANCLVRGGMSHANIEYCLNKLASICDPPFPEKEIQAKIQSAFKRSESQERNLTKEIRDIFVTTSDNITTTFVYQVTTLTTREDRKKALVILGRLVNEGFIERVRGQNGVYRRIESDCEAEDWQSACTDTVDLWLPFDLNEMISIMPGNIILFAGAQDAGKSAVLMNIAKQNMRDWNVHYFSSELNSGAFKSRLNNFPNLSTDQWNVKFYQRSENFQDVIKTGEKDLNLIDYMEVHTEFYLVAEYLAQIHRKLGEAICVVALQKDPNALYGRGGSFTQEKPILSVALDYGKATISKFKGEFKGENPRGKQYLFKLVDGCRIIKSSGWHVPPPKT